MKKYIFPILLFIMLVLTLASATAISFNNEVITQSITDFEWCFDAPFAKDDSVQKEYWGVYQDNLGCDLQEAKLFIDKKIAYSKEECSKPASTCSSEEIDTPNGTISARSCTPLPLVCKNVTKYYIESYDVSNRDILIDEGDRLCYRGKRKAKTGNQACDMNYLFDDGITSYDVKDFGKAWWNVSYNFKRNIQINATNISKNTGFASKIILNSSNFNFASAQGNCGDIRFIDSAETTELPQFLEICNTTGNTIFYVNASITNTTNTTVFVYYNATTTQTVKSDFNSTFGSDLILFVSANDDASDFSDNNNDMAVTGATYTRNDSEEYERVYGGYSFNGVNQKIRADSTDFDFESLNWSLSYWILARSFASVPYVVVWGNSSNAYMTSYFTGTGAVSFFCKGSGGICDGGANKNIITSRTLSTGQWYHVGITYDATADDFAMYIDSALIYNESTVAFNDNGVTSIFKSGIAIGATNDFNGLTDELRFYNRVLTPSELVLLADEPPNTVQSEQTDIEDTTLVTGIMDITYANISTTINESQKFLVWANYTYDANNTQIYPNAFCNMSADETIDEYYSQTPGTNTTVCLGGACTSTNKTVQLTGVSVDGFINDLLQTSVCHNGAVRRDFHIGTSCGSTYDFDFTQAPLCSAGYVNITIFDKNCSAASAVNVSIWSEGTGLTQAIRVVDDLLGMDRLHNHTEDLVYNSSLNLFVGDEFHKYTLHGAKTINVSCFENLTGVVANQTEELSITVENVPPTVIISDIWWWLLSNPVVFTNNIVAKYPLQETINISIVTTDDDLDTTICYLNYSSNGVNIFEATNGGHVQANLTASNFSTNASFLNGTDGYIWQVWANDTTGNESSVQRTFTVQNDAPVGAWTDSSPVLFGATPKTLNFTCTDAESETMTAYVLVDGVLNTTASSSGIIFNYTAGTYNMTLFCEDSFANSTQVDLSAVFTPDCVVGITGVAAGNRYRRLTINNNGLTCTNGVNLTNCSYQVNEFAPETIDSCTDFNITIQPGWNRLNFIINEGNASAANSTINVFGFVESGTFWDYPLLIYMTAICLLLFLASYYFRSEVGFAIFMVAGLRLAYEFISLSILAGVIVSGMVLFVGISGIFAARSSGWLGTGQDY